MSETRENSGSVAEGIVNHAQITDENVDRRSSRLSLNNSIDGRMNLSVGNLNHELRLPFDAQSRNRRSFAEVELGNLHYNESARQVNESGLSRPSVSESISNISRKYVGRVTARQKKSASLNRSIDGESQSINSHDFEDAFDDLNNNLDQVSLSYKSKSSFELSDINDRNESYDRRNSDGTSLILRPISSYGKQTREQLLARSAISSSPFCSIEDYMLKTIGQNSRSNSDPRLFALSSTSNPSCLVTSAEVHNPFSQYQKPCLKNVTSSENDAEPSSLTSDNYDIKSDPTLRDMRHTFSVAKSPTGHRKPVGRSAVVRPSHSVTGALSSYAEDRVHSAGPYLDRSCRDNSLEKSQNRMPKSTSVPDTFSISNGRLSKIYSGDDNDGEINAVMLSERLGNINSHDSISNLQMSDESSETSEYSTPMLELRSKSNSKVNNNKIHSFPEHSSSTGLPSKDVDFIEPNLNRFSNHGFSKELVSRHGRVNRKVSPSEMSDQI